MVPNDFEPRHGALYATAAPNNTESRWATCPDVTMVNGYGEDNVLPHGRQFAIPLVLNLSPYPGYFSLSLFAPSLLPFFFLFLKSRGVSHNEVPIRSLARTARRTGNFIAN